MKLASKVVLVAGMLTIPAAGTAQVANHVSMRLGLFASGQPAFWSGHGVGLAYQPVSEGVWFGFGASSSVSFGIGVNSYYDDYRDGYHDGWGLSHCWDYLWYDPFLDCHGYQPIGFGPFGWRGLHSPWFGPFGFLGWPSPRYVRQHFYAASPFWYGGYSGWHDGWGGYPGYAWGGYPGYGWGGDWYGGRVTRYGYDSRGRAVGRTPLFGPRFKERPTVYVTDNGPERPVSELSPRGGRATQDDISGSSGRTNTGSRATRPWARGTPRTARPRGQADTKVARPDTRTANPRPATRRPPVRTSRPSPVSTTPPKVRKRPEAAPHAGSVTPRRQPTVRTTPPRRQPAVRPTTPRRQPTVRPMTPRRSRPTARSAPSRRPPPKARSAPPRRSPPKVRPAPSRRSPPKARPAPRRSGGSKAPPKRSGPRRRGG